MCYSNSTFVNIYWHCRKLVYKIIVNRGGYKITYFVASYKVYSPSLSLYIYIYYTLGVEYYSTPQAKTDLKNTEYYW
jgi:hypothetical protein